MELTIERAAVEVGIVADGRPDNILHVNVVHELDVDIIASAVDNGSNPLELLGIGHFVEAVNKVAIGFVGSAAVLQVLHKQWRRDKYGCIEHQRR